MSDEDLLKAAQALDRMYAEVEEADRNRPCVCGHSWHEHARTPQGWVCRAEGCECITNEEPSDAWAELRKAGLNLGQP